MKNLKEFVEWWKGYPAKQYVLSANARNAYAAGYKKCEDLYESRKCKDCKYYTDTSNDFYCKYWEEK
jgi:selenophosphate synthetase-related protein